MLKSISASDLRAQIRRILNEVGYGQTEYVVEKFGEPIAAVISMSDFQLLQEMKQLAANNTQADAVNSLQTNLETIHRTLESSGYHPRTKQEIDDQIQAERESWGS